MGMAVEQQRMRPASDPQAVRRGPDLTAEQTAALRARQKSRNRAMLAVLLALVALFFALTISRMSQVENPQALSRPGGLSPSGGVPFTTAPSR
jgi:hypothetical protein